MMKEKRVLLFAGTTEGRKLSEYLTKCRVRVHVCVATAYGESLLPQAENLTVSHERLQSHQISELIREFCPDCVIDATHPYACEVTRNIREACRDQQVEYLRLLRRESRNDNSIYVTNIEDAVEFLRHTEGNILVSTGSKEIEKFTELRHYRERIYARVLSLAAVVKKCEDLGICGRHLICMQGPFSREMNEILLREYEISYFVTKDSGKEGGFPEKYEAAKAVGAKLVVVGRPEETDGASLEEIICLLRKKFHLEEIECGRTEVSLIGIGTGSKNGFTAEALQACRKAEVLIGAGRMVEAAVSAGQECYLSCRAEEIAAYIKEHPEYRKVAVVFSGDIGFYSGAEKLKNMLKDSSRIKIRLIPGISSIVYFAAQLGIAWEDAALCSIHGRKKPVVSVVRDHKKTFFLTGTQEDIRNLCRELTKYGYGKLRIYTGEQLSYEKERIRAGTVEELCDFCGENLTVVYVENPNGGERTTSTGICDEWFIRGKIPMTKEEVRSVSLSKLEIFKDAIIYDVGAGTGSVSVEAALCATDGQVYAIEKDPEGIRLIHENMKKFHVDNVTAVQGEAPEALRGLPAPDCVFVGGSGGKTEEILRAVIDGNPRVRVVVNAVTLETVSAILEDIRKLRQTPDIKIEKEEMVQLSVARTSWTGRYHMMTGMNPVFICSFTCIFTGDNYDEKNA